MSNLHSKWTAGLSVSEAEEVRQQWRGSIDFRNRAVKLLEDKIEAKRKELRDANNYEKPNWDKYLADSIGYERALSEVISLLMGIEK